MQYVLDYTYSMNGAQPYTLSVLPLTISNVKVSGLLLTGTPPTTNVVYGSPFPLTYTVALGPCPAGSNPTSQQVYGKIVYHNTTNEIVEAVSEWTIPSFSYNTQGDIQTGFANGLTTQLNADIVVGHYEYALSVQSNNTSLGTVAITNPSPIPTSWHPGQIATITATNTGGIFNHWEANGVNIGSANPLSYPMGYIDTTIIGYFTAAPVPLSCDADGPYTGQAGQTIYFQGSASGGQSPYSWLWSFGDGTTSTLEDPSHSYASAGTYTVSLQVTDSASNVYTDYTTANISVVQNYYTLTCLTGGTGTGSITTNPANVCGTDILEGTPVYLYANAGSGSYFAGWSGDCTGTTNPCQVVMNGIKNVTATFNLQYYYITASAGAGGSINPSGQIQVLEGNSQTFTITADTSYAIDNVVVDGTSQGAISSYTFNNVTSDHSINAYFKTSGGQCVTGEEQCINGIKWLCINGNWVNTGQTCCNEGDPARCINDYYHICQNGQWVKTIAPCCTEGTSKCINTPTGNFWHECNSDTWIPTEFPCQMGIPTEYIIIGGVAVVGGLVALAAATGGLGGFAIGRRTRKK